MKNKKQKMKNEKPKTKKKNDCWTYIFCMILTMPNKNIGAHAATYDQ